MSTPAKATRQSFGERLAELGATHPEIVVLDADLSKSTKSELFAKKFPDRFFEMGIAEANMIGTAAGLAFTGKIPFLCSFGCFLTGRYDTIRLSVAYAQANVRLVGTHAGVGIGDDGHSQMGLEDISLMRALPTMGVFQPADDVETKALMDFLVKTWKGPAYIRLTRQNLPEVTLKGQVFRPLKIHRVDSTDISSFSAAGKMRVACFASGATVTESLQAQKLLAGSEIEMQVYNVHSLKPFDEESLSKIANHVGTDGLLVSVEDHSVIGGLASCISESISKRGNQPRLLALGIQDQFGESGEPIELYDKFGISAKAIAGQIKENVST